MFLKRFSHTLHHCARNEDDNVDDADVVATRAKALTLSTIVSIQCTHTHILHTHTLHRIRECASHVLPKPAGAQCAVQSARLCKPNEGSAGIGTEHYAYDMLDAEKGALI